MFRTQSEDWTTHGFYTFDNIVAISLLRRAVATKSGNRQSTNVRNMATIMLDQERIDVTTEYHYTW